MKTSWKNEGKLVTLVFFPGQFFAFPLLSELRPPTGCRGYKEVLTRWSPDWARQCGIPIRWTSLLNGKMFKACVFSTLVCDALKSYATYARLEHRLLDILTRRDKVTKSSCVGTNGIPERASHSVPASIAMSGSLAPNEGRSDTEGHCELWTGHNLHSWRGLKRKNPSHAEPFQTQDWLWKILALPLSNEIDEFAYSWLPSALRAKREWKHNDIYMDCDSCWVPNGHKRKRRSN